MRLRRLIYATVLMAIYLIATVSSSASILFCDRHHHHHHADELVAEHDHHNGACSCEGLSFEAECCTHHHPILGENHTDYIASSQRSDSRSGESILFMLLPAVSTVVIPESPEPRVLCYRSGQGLESWPLVAAFISHESLRAPPVVA